MYDVSEGDVEIRMRRGTVMHRRAVAEEKSTMIRKAAQGQSVNFNAHTLDECFYNEEVMSTFSQDDCISRWSEG